MSQAIKTLPPHTILGRSAHILRADSNTGADFAEVEAVLPPCIRSNDLHVHPLQTIQLEALEGKLGIVLPDRRLIIQPGTVVELPQNTEHAVYNAGPQPVRFRSRMEPALHTAWLNDALHESGRRQTSSFRRLLERSYILNRIRGEYYSSGLPKFLQHLIHPLLAGMGRLFGVDKKVRPLY